MFDAGDRRAVAVDVVQGQTFSQRQVTERDLGGAEGLEDGVEQHRPGDDEIGASRVEAGHPQPLGQCHRRQLLAHPAQLLGLDLEVAHVLGCAAAVPTGEPAQTQNGA